MWAPDHQHWMSGRSMNLTTEPECHSGRTDRLWQVSGRSNITDFEEVVKLDTQYIGEWSVKGDISILFKTVIGVLKTMEQFKRREQTKE